MTRSHHPWFKVITWREAEAVLKHKVNRRLKFFTQSDEGKANADNPYPFPDYQVFTYCEWVESCSGCSESIDGYVIYERTGCPECGYTGKRRQGMHVPYIIENEIEFGGCKHDHRKH